MHDMIMIIIVLERKILKKTLSKPCFLDNQEQTPEIDYVELGYQGRMTKNECAAILWGLNRSLTTWDTSSIECKIQRQ